MPGLVSGSSRIVTGDSVWLLAGPDLLAIRGDTVLVADYCRHARADDSVDLDNQDG